MKTEDSKAIDKLARLADILRDGHYTIYKFTTNYRVSLGTIQDPDDIKLMAEGRSLSETVESLVEDLKEGALGC